MFRPFVELSLLLEIVLNDVLVILTFIVLSKCGYHQELRQWHPSRFWKSEFLLTLNYSTKTRQDTLAECDPLCQFVWVLILVVIVMYTQFKVHLCVVVWEGFPIRGFVKRCLNSIQWCGLSFCKNNTHSSAICKCSLSIHCLGLFELLFC
jgi:hypothetical protein